MDNRLHLPVLALDKAKEINEVLIKTGIPTVDRIVIAVSNQDFKTASGIIIPGGEKEDLPKKGTVVQVGNISTEYQYFKDLLQIGALVTFGNYAGKKIEPKNIKIDGFDLTVLSLTEICYVEFL